MSDDRIYVRFKGKTLGPFAMQKVQDLIRRGQITRMHELSSDGLSWSRAEAFHGLCQAQQPAAARPVAADAGASTAAGESTAATAEATATDNPLLLGSPASTRRPGEASEPTVQWYAHVGGENRGPMSATTIGQMIEAGEVHRDTLVWRSGYDDWRPAGESFPERFARSVQQFDSAGELRNVATRLPRSEIGGQLAKELARPRGWVLFLAIFGLIGCGLSALYSVLVMVVGAESRFTPYSGAAAVIVGLSGLLQSGIGITGAILMLRYAASLKFLTYQQDKALIAAVRRLNAMWQFWGIVLLVVLTVSTSGLIISLIVAAAAANAVT